MQVPSQENQYSIQLLIFEPITDFHAQGNVTSEDYIPESSKRISYAVICNECIVKKKIFNLQDHCNRLRLRSSFTISSSSVLSAVSLGLRSEWTLDARLDRLENGPGGSVAFWRNLDPAIDHELSALVVEGVVSLVNGGVVCLEPHGRGCCCISYRARTSRTCSG